jgi:hypothetical protein
MQFDKCGENGVFYYIDMSATMLNIMFNFFNETHVHHAGFMVQGHTNLIKWFAKFFASEN